MLVTQEKKITLSFWYDGNDDFSVTSGSEPKKLDNEIAKIVPTSVIRAGKNVDGISTSITRYHKQMSKVSGAKHLLSYVMATKEYWESYKRGVYWRYHNDNQFKKLHETISSALEYIVHGNYERIVHDATISDGFFYDVEGNPVCRALYVDYIQSHSRLDYHNEKKLTVNQVFEKLKKNPKVIDLKWVEIPYYNQGDDGLKEIFEFAYNPTEREFRSMVAECRSKNMEFWSCGMKEILWNRIGILADK